MNHYPHHLGDYAKDTQGLTQGEHGAYDLLIFAAYSTERAIPADEVNAITKAATAAERKNTAKVLRKFWVLEQDGWHQKRIDEEIAVYRAKASKASESANKRWAKPVDNNAPAMPTDKRTHKPTDSEGTTERISEGNAKAMLTSNQEPEDQNHRFPGDNTTTAPEGRKAAQEDSTPNPDARAKILAECQRAKVDDVTEASQIITRWLRDGATASQVVLALAEARRPGCKPFPAELRLGYVDAILVRILYQDRKAREANEAKVQRTQAVIAEGIAAKEKAVPKPPDFPKVKRAAA